MKTISGQKAIELTKSGKASVSGKLEVPGDERKEHLELLRQAAGDLRSLMNTIAQLLAKDTKIPDITIPEPNIMVDVNPTPVEVLPPDVKVIQPEPSKKWKHTPVKDNVGKTIYIISERIDEV